MVKKYTYKDITWVDLESPTNEEVREVMEEYNIHPIAAQNLVLPDAKPCIDIYEDFISLILHFPAWKHTHKEPVQEMDFIVGKKFIVTARYERIDAMDKFAKTFEVNSVLESKNGFGLHAGSIFFHMIKELYSSLDDELESIRDVLSDIEKKIFTGHEKQMVLKLSNVSRELLSFKHALAMHETLLGSFGASAIKLFGENYSKSVHELMNEYAKISKSIQGHHESLHELRETNNALLEARQSEIMKTFTAITVISSFLTIISSWFLIESPDKPFVDGGHEFWLVGVVMLIIAIILAILMKWKKWL